jgi:mycothiol synthase
VKAWRGPGWEEALALAVEFASENNVADMIRYCAEHGSEHDDSYLPSPDFVPSPQQPSYLLMEDGQVVGAVSLMRTPRFTQSNQARFAIFHALANSDVAYRRLFDAIKPHFDGLDEVFLFITEQLGESIAILEGLGFAATRYSFVLEKPDLSQPQPRFHPGVRVRTLLPNDDDGLQAFARLINLNFGLLAGHTDIGANEIRGWFKEPEYLDGGIVLLTADEGPIGTASVSREYGHEERAEVSALGIAPSHRGEGLGRGLLRWAGDFALEKGFRGMVLSVNAENEGALQLYRSEGYQLIETVVCYTYPCS